MTWLPRAASAAWMELPLSAGVRLAEGTDVGSCRVRLKPLQLAALGCAFGDAVLVTLWHEDAGHVTEWRFLCTAAAQPQGDGGPAQVDATVQTPPLGASLEQLRHALGSGTPCRAAARKLPGRPVACDTLVTSGGALGAEALLRGRVVLPPCVLHLGNTQLHVLRAQAASAVGADTPLRVVPGTRMSRDDGHAVAATSPVRQQPGNDTVAEALPDGNTPSPACVVGGSPAALTALTELISWPMAHGAAAAALGVRWPRGVLLHGPPGCGKTLLVHAAAARCGAALHCVSSGDVVGAWAGESERNLRAAFAAANATVAGGTPCVLFLDELDALCPRRGAGGAHDARLTAQLLVLMDGADAGTQGGDAGGGPRLLVVGATNRPDALDPALRRPGRLEREIEVPVPDGASRTDILVAHTGGLCLASDVDLPRIAAACHGYSGADMAALAREAAMVAVEQAAAATCGDDDSAPVPVTAACFAAALSRVGASLARGTAVEAPPVSWDHIGGLHAVKHRLRQAVEWPIKHSAACARLGLKPPKGVLLHGPPGCSKTQLARAAAAASGATFIPLMGSQLFSMYLGQGERALAAAFARARACAPAIIFVDEVDSIATGRRAGGDGHGGSGAEERLLSTLLTELDGLHPSAGVLLLGATNRAHVLDAALLRPGRLEVHLYVPPPDQAGRCEVLAIHTARMPLARDVDLAALATQCAGYTGAELAALCCEAAQVAVRSGGADVAHVTHAHFLAALATMPPSLTPHMLEQYAAFDAATRRST